MVEALKAAGNNRARAARLLGITRGQLYRRLRKHGIATTPFFRVTAPASGIARLD